MHHTMHVLDAPVPGVAHFFLCICARKLNSETAIMNLETAIMNLFPLNQQFSTFSDSWTTW